MAVKTETNHAGFLNSSRRELLSTGLTLGGWGTLFTLSVGGGVESVRFFSPSVVFRPSSTFEVGKVEDFVSEGAPDAYGVISVEARWKKEHRFFILRERSRLCALFARCPHLGCTINWFPGLNIFKCPCHGSQFYSNGVNFAGPAPRSLDLLRVSKDSDGKILVDASVVYTREQYEQAKAYVEI